MPDDRGDAVHIWSLGKSAGEINGMPIPGWRPTKTLVLFHYLLDRRNHPVGRATLTETFWPDEDARAPETSLKVAIHGLRRMLSGTLGPGPGAGSSNGSGPGSRLAIETHRSGYLLRAEGVWYDAAEFERNITEASRFEAKGVSAQALTPLGRAVRLYRGNFLAGAGGDWVLRRRQALADRYLHALMRLAEAHLSARKYHTSISLCLKALNEDPCCERSYQILMLCQARIGMAGGVHAWHDLCTQTLSDRLGTGPSRETERLFHQLRGVSQVRRSLPSPANNSALTAVAERFG